MKPPLNTSKTLSEVASVAAIAGVFAAYLMIVPPTGEYPTLDDFDFAASAWYLAETGKVSLSDWPEMTLVGHIVWGGLFAAVGGRSFFTLRLSMFAMSAITALALYVWSRRCGHPRSLSMWFAITFAVNPLTVNFQYTFMTDLSGVTGAALLLLLAPRLDASARRPLIGYSILAGIAYCTRETAVLPFIVYCGLASLYSIRTKRVGNLFWLLAPFGTMFVGYQLWLHLWHGVPSFRTLPNISVGSATHHLARLFLVTGMLALQLLPVSLLLMTREKLCRERTALIVSTIFVTVSAGTCMCIFGGLPSPYSDVVFDLGLRSPELPVADLPAALRGAEVNCGPYSISLFRLVMTGSALFSIVVLSTWIVTLRQEAPTKRDPVDLKVIVAGLTFLATLLLFQLTASYSERYTLALFVPAMMSVAALLSTQESPRRPVPLVAWLATASIGVCSLIGIQDGMQRSRAFWSAIDEIHEVGVETHHIDAGVAYAGFYRFNPYYRGEGDPGPFLHTLLPDEHDRVLAAISPESLTGNRYFHVSFKKEAGYDVVDTSRYQAWFRSGEVFIQLRDDTDRSQLGAEIREWVAESE